MNIVVCDLETTSANVFDAEIIHGSFFALNQDLEIVSEFELRANPFRYSEEAYAVHGISREECANYKRFSMVYRDLINWFKLNHISEFWCHANASMYGKLTYYDFAVLRINLLNMGQEAYYEIAGLKVFSTHTLCRLYQSHYNFSGLSLNEVCSTLKIPLMHHNARSDAMACVEIMKRLKIDRDAMYNLERSINEHERTVRPRRSSKKQSKGDPKHTFVIPD